MYSTQDSKQKEQKPNDQCVPDEAKAKKTIKFTDVFTSKTKKAEIVPPAETQAKVKADKAIKAETKKIKKSTKADEEKNKEIPKETGALNKIKKESKVITKSKKAEGDNIKKTTSVIKDLIKTEPKSTKTEIVETTTTSKLTLTESTLKSKSTSDMEKSQKGKDLGAVNFQNGSASFDELNLNFQKCDLKVKGSPIPLLLNSKVVNCTPRPFSRNSCGESKMNPEGKILYLF